MLLWIWIPTFINWGNKSLWRESQITDPTETHSTNDYFAVGIVRRRFSFPWKLLMNSAWYTEFNTIPYSAYLQLENFFPQKISEDIASIFNENFEKIVLESEMGVCCFLFKYIAYTSPDWRKDHFLRKSQFTEPYNLFPQVAILQEDFLEDFPFSNGY